MPLSTQQDLSTNVKLLADWIASNRAALEGARFDAYNLLFVSLQTLLFDEKLNLWPSQKIKLQDINLLIEEILKASPSKLPAL